MVLVVVGGGVVLVVVCTNILLRLVFLSACRCRLACQISTYRHLTFRVPAGRSSDRGLDSSEVAALADAVVVVPLGLEVDVGLEEEVDGEVMVVGVVTASHLGHVALMNT